MVIAGITLRLEENELDNLLQKCDLVIVAHTKKHKRRPCSEYEVASALREILLIAKNDRRTEDYW